MATGESNDQPTTRMSRLVADAKELIDKEPQRALELLNQVISDARHIAIAFCLRGTISHSEKEYQKAEHDYARAIQVDPNYARAIFNLGHLKHDQNDYLGAIRYYNQAVEIECEARFFYQRARAFLALNEYAKSIDDLNRCLDAGVQDQLVVFFLRGVVYASQGKHELAEKEFERIIAIDSNETKALVWCCSAKLHLGKYTEAKSLIEQAVTKGASYAEVFFQYGQVYLYQGDYSAAIEKFEWALERDPEHREAREKLNTCRNSLSDESQS